MHVSSFSFCVCVCGVQHTYILCWSYLALGNLVLLVSVHHRDRLNSDLLHFISLQRNKTTRYLLFCAYCGKPPDHLTVLFWVIGVVGHAKLQHYLQARIEAWLLKLEAWSWHWNFLSSNSIPLYLSPELSIDVVSCESCDLPPLGNRTQVTCCHHQTNHTVPGGEQSLVISMQKETKAAFKDAFSATGVLTCANGCSGPDHGWSGAPSAAGGCWSRGRGRWRWWPSGWSPAPARTRWNSGWRKYCALPAMKNKEINKKAKAPLMRRSAQLHCNKF